jgi:hypothetical protein
MGGGCGSQQRARSRPTLEGIGPSQEAAIERSVARLEGRLSEGALNFRFRPSRVTRDRPLSGRPVRCWPAGGPKGILQLLQVGPNARLSLGGALSRIAANAAVRPMPSNGFISAAANTIKPEQPSLLPSVHRPAGTHWCCASPASRSQQARGRRSIDRLHRWACPRPSDA